MIMNRSLTVVAALDDDGVIGNGQEIPWYIPEDFKHFKNYTTGKTLIMGRTTFDSIGKPLPNRKTIVVTRNKDWCYTGVQVAHSLDEAIGMTDPEEEVIIAGGGALYAQALPKSSAMVLSRIAGSHEGDTFFPQVMWEEWDEINRESYDDFVVEYYRRSKSC